MKEIIRALDNQPLAIVDGRKFIINPLTEQIPFTSSELLSETCKLISQKLKKEYAIIVVVAKGCPYFCNIKSDKLFF